MVPLHLPSLPSLGFFDFLDSFQYCPVISNQYFQILSLIWFLNKVVLNTFNHLK